MHSRRRPRRLLRDTLPARLLFRKVGQTLLSVAFRGYDRLLSG